MPTPDLQDLFDRSTSALLKQGRPALNGDGSCVYRAPDGCKCAVGHLIPDNAFDPRWDQSGGIRIDSGTCFGDRLRKVVVGDSDGYTEAINLLGALQSAHDSSAEDPDWLGAWKKRVREVANRFELNTKVLDDAEQVVPA